MASFLKSNEQWLKITWAALALGAGVTVFAYSNFEEKGSAAKVEKSLKQDIRVLDRKMDALLLRQGLQPREYED